MSKKRFHLNSDSLSYEFKINGVVVHPHHFFVPMSLIWDDFEEFITGKKKESKNEKKK